MDVPWRRNAAGANDRTIWKPQSGDECLKDKQDWEEVHDFGQGGIHQPTNWPEQFYSQGLAICPPHVPQEATPLFTKHARKYFFMDLPFRYM
eukprot:5347867-Heterocapsa_arctica.AAC.1